jgi:hypothetical protein
LDKVGDADDLPLLTEAAQGFSQNGRCLSAYVAIDFIKDEASGGFLFGEKRFDGEKHAGELSAASALL